MKQLLANEVKMKKCKKVQSTGYFLVKIFLKLL